MYRPEGIKKYSEIKHDATISESEAYEVGLKALAKVIYIKANEIIKFEMLDEFQASRSGYLLFIPEGE